MDCKCENCKLYKGDCKHHFIDDDGHIHYDCWKESACDCFGNYSYYQESRSDIELAIDEVKSASIRHKTLILKALREFKEEGDKEARNERMDTV